MRWDFSACLGKVRYANVTPGRKAKGKKKGSRNVPGTEMPYIGVDFCFFSPRLIHLVRPIFENCDRQPKYQVAFPTLGRSADSCPEGLLAGLLVPVRVRLLPRMENASAAPLTLEVFARMPLLLPVHHVQYVRESPLGLLEPAESSINYWTSSASSSCINASCSNTSPASA